MKLDVSIEIEVKEAGDWVCLRYDIPKPFSTWGFGSDETSECYILPKSYYNSVRKRGPAFFLMRGANNKLRDKKHYVWTDDYLKEYLAGNVTRQMYHGDYCEQDQWAAFDLMPDNIYQQDGWGYLLKNGEHLPEIVRRVDLWETYYKPKEIVAAADKCDRIIKAEIVDNDVWQNHEISGRHYTHVYIRLNAEQAAEWHGKAEHEEQVMIGELLGVKRRDEDYDEECEHCGCSCNCC